MFLKGVGISVDRTLPRQYLSFSTHSAPSVSCSLSLFLALPAISDLQVGLADRCLLALKAASVFAWVFNNKTNHNYYSVPNPGAFKRESGDAVYWIQLNWSRDPYPSQTSLHWTLYNSERKECALLPLPPSSPSSTMSASTAIVQNTVSNTTSNSTSDERRDLFSTTKGKMKVQQRMIDLTARELESTRLSSRAILSESSAPSEAFKENIVLVEVVTNISFISFH